MRYLGTWLHVFLLLTCVTFPLTAHVYAIPSSNLLQVPFHAQQGDIWCGPASVQMAIEYISGEKVDQSVLAREMHTGPKCGGTCTGNMALPFRNRNWTVVQAWSDLNELKELNWQGFVSIINIWSDTRHAYGHYVVVVGYNEGGILVHDPTRHSPMNRRAGPNAPISNEILADLWTHHSNWMLKIPYTRLSTSTNSSYTLTTSTTSTTLTVTSTTVTTTSIARAQFYLKVMSPFGQSQGEGQYNEGETVTFSVSPTRIIGVQPFVDAVFVGWTGASTSNEATATVIMDSDKAVTAVWANDYGGLYLISMIVGLAAAVCLSLVIIRRRRRRQK